MKILKDIGCHRLLLACLLSVSLMASASAVPLRQASVTEAVNSVSYQSNANAAQEPATTGTTIQPDNIVRTGIKSRAELQFNDHTVTRMGANSVFTFDAQAQKMSLEQGSMLFPSRRKAVPLKFRLRRPPARFPARAALRNPREAVFFSG